MESFAGPIIATGVASTSFLVVALIIYFCRNKQGEAENCDSDPIFSQEENKDHRDEKCQWQEESGARPTHEQRKRLRATVHLSFIEVKGFMAHRYQVRPDFSSVVLEVSHSLEVIIKAILASLV